jgi:fructose-bisphosphate aldolase class I
MNAMDDTRPWQLSFSFARALQAPPLQLWRGDAANVPAAQQAFYHRAKCNSAARYSRYHHTMEKDRGY